MNLEKLKYVFLEEIGKKQISRGEIKVKIWECNCANV